MTFYYKTINEKTGMVRDVDSLPHNVDKLIIRRYDGIVLQLNRIDTLNHLILDCNIREIHDICFKCDKLSIYRPNVNWFHINHTWFGYDDQLHSTFNILNRLKLEHVRDTSSMLANALCTNIIPELDFTGIQWCYDMFKNTNIDKIQHNIKIPTEMNYVGFYGGSKIPQHKLLAIDKLVVISKKGKVS